MFSFTPLWRTAVFFARIVMPFSRSRSIESMTRSLTSWFWRKAPDCQSMASTSVVFPWSTWATIATLRRSSRTAMRQMKLAGDPLCVGGDPSTRAVDFGSLAVLTSRCYVRRTPFAGAGGPFQTKVRRPKLIDEPKDASENEELEDLEMDADAAED